MIDYFLANVVNDLERRIAEAFEVFDHGGNKTVDVREVGTIIRSLGTRLINFTTNYNLVNLVKISL